LLAPWYRFRVPRALHHPHREQLSLAAVLEALSDPVRLDIVLRLEESGENRCGSFEDLGGKANLTYHFARLREAGVTQTRLEGPFRFVSLRTKDLEARFPGLLAAVLAGARRERGTAARTRRGEKL
jgi:DNA-binding transcriptional ArsR family regulator